MKRNTIQKKLILDSVENLKNHPTADEIYEDIANTHPTISKGTVYRNLNTMCDENAVFRVKVHNGSDRFDFNIKPHYHFECQECKKVFDIDFEYIRVTIQ